MVSTDFDQIVLQVTDRLGQTHAVNIPQNAELNLMEVLKTSEFKMRATCGGMGLCADCHCQVEKGLDQLPPPTFQELETLDTLPDATAKSRLACQIMPGEYLHHVSIQLMGKDPY